MHFAFRRGKKSFKRSEPTLLWASVGATTAPRAAPTAPEPLAVTPPQPLIILQIINRSDTGPADRFLSYRNSLKHLRNADFSAWGQAHGTAGAEFPTDTWYCIGWMFCQVKIKPIFFFLKCWIFLFCSQGSRGAGARAGKGQKCPWLSKATPNNWRSISWTAWAWEQNLPPAAFPEGSLTGSVFHISKVP